MKDLSGPAFPGTEYSFYEGMPQVSGYYVGMTKRELIAMNTSIEDVESLIPTTLGDIQDWGLKHGVLERKGDVGLDACRIPKHMLVAWAKVVYADALLAELGRE